MNPSVEALLAALAESPVSQWIRQSRWGYAWVSAAHILGIGLLIGAILPLDLRLLGLWRSVPLAMAARIATPVAAFGLALAIGAGSLLFLARPAEYAAQPLFLTKIGLVALGGVHALALHLGPGLASVSPQRRRLAGAVSAVIWLSALLCGRFLAFVGE